MPGPEKGFRNRLFRAVHAEALKRKLDHDALHELAVTRYGVHTMSELTDEQLLAIYRSWTGKGLKRAGKLPSRGELAVPGDAMVSADDLELLGREFAKRGLGDEGKRNFVRRQLRGRETIRSRKDLVRVSLASNPETPHTGTAK